MTDWINALAEFTQADIGAACDSCIRESVYRPTPADIRKRIEEKRSPKIGGTRGDRSKLTADEVALLDGQIIPTARRWLMTPHLAKHGRQTLEFWGEQ